MEDNNDGEYFERHFYLVFPPRTAKRKRLYPVLGIADNDLEDNADYGMIPPQCQNLTLSPFPDLSDDLPTIPWSVKRLVLDNLTTRSNDIFECAFFQEGLPPTLRSLTICESGSDGFLGAATVRGLAKGLGKLPHLKVLHLDECPYLKGADVMAGLPRTGMREIRLQCGLTTQHVMPLTTLRPPALTCLDLGDNHLSTVLTPLPLKVKYLGVEGRAMV
ncbi:hypothetical protein GGF31_006077 [Allomyces arbusculus]|nr:hypothetical protein GGF31_006077 [Allomyces arbusculus]